MGKMSLSACLSRPLIPPGAPFVATLLGNAATATLLQLAGHAGAGSVPKAFLTPAPDLTVTELED